ncbi:transporter substrate-binding domain-containing protein [Isoptericola dokdonensis]|uniref:Arginine-binding extracellular protein ArtP n=1 Tax=Isoptericola dokdonensis DS-3 TaxID=1300344 RepID=A0A161HSS5_9MICO|nr:transporter substrate-binding domain-containing protein [Isoptericola dokdonensis]ANC32632.1 Arginine-binding extracellular protein ArtP precursor [Isoptericola dokdonensis DS-3]
MPSTRTTNRRRVLTATGSVLALAALTACTSVDENGAPEGGESTLAQLQDAGEINVGFFGEVPYSYEEGGELTGATIELGRAIYGELGIDTVSGTQVEWNALIPGVQADRFDAVSAGMSILPERCEQAAFAEPTIMYTTAFLVPEGNPQGLTDWQSVEGGDVTLAVTQGAIEAGYAEETDVDAMEVPDRQAGLDAVVSGRADAYALTGISLRSLAEGTDAPVEATDAFIATINGEPQIGAGAEVFRSGDTELLEAYNEQLAPIVADEAAWLEIMEPFGFSAAEMPPEGLTSEALCDPDQDLSDLADELGMDY